NASISTSLRCDPSDSFTTITFDQGGGGGGGGNVSGEDGACGSGAVQGFQRIIPVATQQRPRTAIQKLGALLARARSFLGPLGIGAALQTGVDNRPRTPIYRGVGSAELADIFSTTPASFRPGPGGIEGKQFFLTLSGAQQFSSLPRSDVSAIVSTHIRPSTLQQGTPLSLTSGESAGAAAVHFPLSALPSLNADAAQTGIQIVQRCGND
ncbi:MAG: hypothetical protein AAGD92_16085, partial [Pseudomonadota bacterium]